VRYETFGARADFTGDTLIITGVPALTVQLFDEAIPVWDATFSRRPNTQPKAAGYSGLAAGCCSITDGVAAAAAGRFSDLKNLSGVCRIAVMAVNGRP